MLGSVGAFIITILSLFLQPAITIPATASTTGTTQANITLPIVIIGLTLTIILTYITLIADKRRKK